MRWGSFVVPTLTEDMLSAIKIGTVAEGWAVGGTKASDHLIAELLRRKARVNVWLDPDGPGRVGASKLCKQLRSYGLEVRDIVSQRDPKLHTRDEIMEYVS
jgi:DNA primase